MFSDWSRPDVLALAGVVISATSLVMSAVLGALAVPPERWEFARRLLARIRLVRDLLPRLPRLSRRSVYALLGALFAACSAVALIFAIKSYHPIPGMAKAIVQPFTFGIARSAQAEAAAVAVKSNYWTGKGEPPCESAECVTLKVILPKNATIQDVRYAFAEPGKDWNYSSNCDQAIGWCQWVGNTQVHIEDNEKVVTQVFKNWNSDVPRRARLQVIYVPG